MLQAPLLGASKTAPSFLKTARHTSYIVFATRSFATTKVRMEANGPRRRIHSSSTRPSPPTALDPAAAVPSLKPRVANTEDFAMAKPVAPLSVLPLSAVIRTLATTTISSSPLLLPPSLVAMQVLAHTQNPILNPDKNPLLRWFLKKTFYSQFCAGENAAEVRGTVNGLRKIGFTGVILGYAREVVLSESQTKNLTACDQGTEKEECIRNEIGPWAAGTMETVRLAQSGDFVALKFTGAGRQALYALKNRLPVPQDLRVALDEICALARERNIPLLFDAEQTALQAGIDDWTLEYQRRYNTIPGHAIIYGTYQAYLKACPAVLASHMVAAAKDGFTLGIKLVRGAYLGADPRHIIHDTKEDTDRCYDAITESLIQRQWNDVLSPTETVEYPLVSLLLGSHNLQSVRHASAVRDAIAIPPPTTYPAQGPCGELAIAQLQGMADEVSCELLALKRAAGPAGADRTRAYKYIVWGTTGECMKYLLRRAMENKDAVQRTRDGRNAMWGEVKRRFWGVLGRA